VVIYDTKLKKLQVDFHEILGIGRLDRRRVN